MLALYPDLGLKLASPALAAPGTIATLLTVGLLAQIDRRRRHHQRISRAIHELRRPLQALILTSPREGVRARPALTALDLALAALGDLENLLDHEVRRPRVTSCWRGLTWRELLEDATDRWSQAAWLRAGHISLGACPSNGGPTDVDQVIELARALDNLIVNALVHGGPLISLSVSVSDGLVAVAVCDRGPAGPRQPTAISGGERHGQGLKIVSEIAAGLGGSFHLERREQETRAYLIFPWKMECER